MSEKNAASQYSRTSRGREGGKREDRPHTTSSSVHRVAEATLKSVPQVLTCITKITADWGERFVWRGKSMKNLNFSQVFRQY